MRQITRIIFVAQITRCIARKQTIADNLRDFHIKDRLLSWICDDFKIPDPLIDFHGRNIVTNFHVDWLGSFRVQASRTHYDADGRRSWGQPLASVAPFIQKSELTYVTLRK